MHTVYSDIRIIAHSSTIKIPLNREMQKKVARESFLHHGPKKHECKKCRKIVTSDSVERWASHLRSCANVCSETKSLLPTAKDSCRPSVIVIDGSTQPNGCLPGPSSSWKNQPSCSYIGTPEVLAPNAICSAMHILILSIYIGAASVVHTTCTSSHSVHEVHCTTHYCQHVSRGQSINFAYI